MFKNTLIGITQQVEFLPERNEKRDALDQRWSLFLKKCNIDFIQIPNCLTNPVKYCKNKHVEGIILTGGNNISELLFPADPTSEDCAVERDKTESKLIKASIENGWSIIGICRGMQVLNLFFGGNISVVNNHVKCCHRLIHTKSSYNFQQFDETVNSYHNYGILEDDIAPDMDILAKTDNVIEAIRHTNYNHIGIMWHPERNELFSENDIQLFRKVFIDDK